MSKRKERDIRSYNPEQVLQVDINRVLHLLYLDAKAEEQLDDWTQEEDYKLKDTTETNRG